VVEALVKVEVRRIADLKKEYHLRRLKQLGKCQALKKVKK
jgi:hypothetical protein